MPKSISPRHGGAKKISRIYLDYASSALSASSNPGAIHELGVKEKNKLENARTTVAGILNTRNNEIIFTSGATESNNLAILGLINAKRQQVKNLVSVSHIVTTNIEHASVLEVCKYLEKTKQAEVTYVPVESNGIVDSKKIGQALRENTVLVSVMYADNEIGAIQPIREIAKEIRHWNKNRKRKVFEWSGWGRDPGNRGPEKTLPFPVFFHTDATQAVNYLFISIPQLGVDMMSFNSAKIYGPKGVGVLYVKKNTPISPIMFGGNQEFGLRPGTESVALAKDFAKALQETEKIKEKEVKRLTKLQDYFLKKLSVLQNVQKINSSAFALGDIGQGTHGSLNLSSARFVSLIINGDLKKRLPNNINITIPNIPSDLLVIELSAKGIMTSSKSACKAG